MASFEDYASRKNQKDVMSSLPKHPLKRFEPALEKFVKVALPTDLQRLHRHQMNMEKFYESRSWHELNAEQINAARTVQQLKVNIREMENIRHQLIQTDIPVFDERVLSIKDEALEGVRSFRDVQRLYSERHKRKQHDNHDASNRSSTDYASGQEEFSRLRTDYQQQQLLLEEESAASWDVLQQNLEDLNTLIHDFSAMVHDQQSTLDTITDNIERAQVNVQQGTKELGKARKLQTVMLPVLGALIGTVAGGPVGMVFGLKLGAAAAVTGGIAGFAGGEILKKKNQENVDMELQNLSTNTENRIVKKTL